MQNIKFVIAGVFMLLLSNTSNAGITVSKNGGGTNGYYSIAENHVNGNHQLFCNDPGNSKCSWVNPPLVSTSNGTYDIDNLTLQVEGNIANQNYNGSFILDQEIIVSWYGQDVYNYEMSVSPL